MCTFSVWHPEWIVEEGVVFLVGRNNKMTIDLVGVPADRAELLCALVERWDAGDLTAAHAIIDLAEDEPLPG